MVQFEADRVGQFRPDEVGQAKSESVDQCDRILQFTADADYIRSKGIKQGIYKSEYHLRKIAVNNKDAILRYFE